MVLPLSKQTTQTHTFPEHLVCRIPEFHLELGKINPDIVLGTLSETWLKYQDLNDKEIFDGGVYNACREIVTWIAARYSPTQT